MALSGIQHDDDQLELSIAKVGRLVS